jgi:hypothetical protein
MNNAFNFESFMSDVQDELDELDEMFLLAQERDRPIEGISVPILSYAKNGVRKDSGNEVFIPIHKPIIEYKSDKKIEKKIEKLIVSQPSGDDRKPDPEQERYIAILTLQETWLSEMEVLSPEDQGQLATEREKIIQLREAISNNSEADTDRTMIAIWTTLLRQQRAQISNQKANQLLARKDVRAHLCSALSTVSDDAFEIAKVTTPVLMGLIAAGVLSVPLLPLLSAAVAFVIARMGIASLCAEHKEKKEY